MRGFTFRTVIVAGVFLGGNAGVSGLGVANAQDCASTAYAVQVGAKNGPVIRTSIAGDAINCGAPATLSFSGDASAVTIEAMIRPLSMSGQQNIVSRGGEDSPTMREFAIRIRDNRYEIVNWDGTETGVATGPNFATDAGTWVHIAAAYSPTDRVWRLYRNGLEVASTGPSRGMISPGFNYSWAIASRGHPGLGTRVLNGETAEVRIWNVARTQAQISASLACATTFAAGAGPIVLYRFDENSGTTVADSAGTNTAQIIGTGVSRRTVWRDIDQNGVLDICQAPVITMQPTAPLLCANGSSAIMSMGATSLGPSGQMFRWYRNGQWTDNSRPDLILRPNLGSTGSWVCRVTNAYNQFAWVETTPVTVGMTIATAASDSNTDRTLCPGQTTVLSPQVLNGTSTPLWWRQDPTTSSWDQQASGSSLTVVAPTVPTRYQVIAPGLCGSAVLEYVVRPALPTVTFTIPPTDQTFQVGEAISLSAFISVDADVVSVAWFRGPSASQPAFAPTILTRPSAGAPISAAVQQLLNTTMADAGPWELRVSAPGCQQASAVASFQITRRACTGDFDNSGTITAADIFEYLNAWFAGEPRANVDPSGSGVIDAADLFLFLNNWFAGCS